MPGVIVNTSVRSGPSGVGEVKEAQAFFAGQTARGSVTVPVLVRGMAEFETYYGGYATGNLYADVRTFFEEGGQRAHIFRVLGSGASASALVLDDGDAENTLRIDAANPGTWGDTLSVEVAEGDAPDTFKILVYLSDVLQYTTRDLASPADAVVVLNTSPVNHLIEVTDLESATAAPGNNPAVAAAANLASGSDGSAVVEDDFLDALDFFTYDLGAGAVALPTATPSANVYNALILHAEANHRVALMSFGEDDTVEEAMTAIRPYYSNENAEYAAFFFPWVKIPDPATAGLQINVSPVSYAAAARAKAITLTGPWRVGAGLLSESVFVNGLVEDINLAKGNLLDENRINAIRKIGNSFRIYGARSASSDEDNWRYITFRDTINFIVSQAELRLEDYIFQTIDARGALFSRIEAALVGLLDPIRVDGGLFEAFDAEGALVDPGYSVEVSDTINPVAQLARGTVSAKVGVRISSVGDTIVVTVTKSNLTTSVV